MASPGQTKGPAASTPVLVGLWSTWIALAELQIVVCPKADSKLGKLQGNWFLKCGEVYWTVAKYSLVVGSISIFSYLADNTSKLLWSF